MRISDWSSDVCSSDLPHHPGAHASRLLRLRALRCRARLRLRGYLALPELLRRFGTGRRLIAGHAVGATAFEQGRDRTSVVEGKRVSVRLDLGGRRIIKKKQNINNTTITTHILK